MRRCLIFLVLCVGLAGSLSGKGIRYGMSRAEVEAALGAPSAVLTHGARIVLIYPKNGRVELEQDRTTTIVNLPLDTGNSSAAPAPPAVKQTKPAPKPPPSKEDKARAAQAAAAEAAAQRQQLEIQRKLTAEIERLSADHGKEPLVIGPTPAQFWAGLFIALVFRTLLTVVVLKLAFNWSDVHADWGQMFLPALANSVSQAVIGAVIFALWSTNQLFYLDEAVSFFVLLWVLMKTTHACTLQRAIAVACAAKLFTIVVWTFFSVMITRLVI